MRTCSVLVPRSTRKQSIGGWHGADRVLQERERVAQLRGRVDDQRAADDVGVAVQVLRHRVRDDVGAELERALEVRRHERVVDARAARRARWQTSATAAMSTSLSIGLVGVSTHTSFVLRLDRRRDALGVARGST